MQEQKFWQKFRIFFWNQFLVTIDGFISGWNTHKTMNANVFLEEVHVVDQSGMIVSDIVPDHNASLPGAVLLQRPVVNSRVDVVGIIFWE